MDSHRVVDGEGVNVQRPEIMKFVGKDADAAKRPGDATHTWTIDGNDGFHVPGLVGNESIARISLIAKGIVEHGRDVISAYLVGDRDKDLTEITDAFVNAVKFLSTPFANSIQTSTWT